MAKVKISKKIVYVIAGGALLLFGFLFGQGTTPKEHETTPTPTAEPAPTIESTPTIEPSPTPTLTPELSPEVKSATPPPEEIQLPPPQTGGYTCDCSKKCSEMSSCEEAYYQLNICGCSVRDGDKDGVPCENICPGG